jgi:DNA polymerase III delta subunit
MHSNWQLWNFFKQFPKGLKSSSGSVLFEVFDPVIGMLLKKRIMQYYAEFNIQTVVSDKLTSTWVENNLQTLGFFGMDECYIIQSADDLSKDVIAQLKSMPLNCDSRFICFISYYSSKPSLKLKDVVQDVHVIDLPKFWESANLLDFLSDELKVRLNFDAKNYILQNIQHGVVDFYNTLNVLQINYPDAKEINLQQVQNVIQTTRYDHFELASLYSQKKKIQFLEKMFELAEDFDQTLRVFQFVLSHLYKLYDVSYIEKKDRPTKYDKEILNHSKLWTKQQLSEQIEILSQYERLAKMKSNMLINHMRMDYMQQQLGLGLK